MTRTTLHRFGSLVAGVAVGGGLWEVGTDPGLASAVGVSAVVAGLVTSRIVRLHSERISGTTWRDQKWAAAFVAFLTVVTLNGLLSVPASFENRVALHLLVGLAAFVAYFFGVIEERERGERPADGTATEPNPADD